MEPKKTKSADLESKRIIFEEIGLIIALAIILFAFNIKSYEHQTLDLVLDKVDDVPEEMVEITQQTKPPPPPKPQKQTTIIEIVENEMEVEEEIEIDVEADQETIIEEYDPFNPVDEEEEEEVEEAPVFVVVEVMPRFPGGDEALKKYLAENIKYPEMARESGIQGRVYVTFVVEKDGSVTNVELLRGIGGGCDQEAIRVVENMPNWNPGRQRDKPVRVQFNLPITFVLK